jgi:flagellar motor switch protein FliN/FliY
MIQRATAAEPPFDSAFEPMAEALKVRIELGRTRMHVQQVMSVRSGAVVPLEAPDDSRVDVYVGDQLVARGEVLVHDGNICVRVTEVVGRQRFA